MSMRVFITIDTEVWPVHPGGWPKAPLPSHASCDREMSAYFEGDTADGQYGLPYQLAMLQQHGLEATYFVDPLFSFALGLVPLARVVRMIEAAGQKVALHLHPEWLTDPRCTGLPQFKGPYLASYAPEVQRQLIRIGWQRLIEAGADPLPAFRAGSWGASRDTLQALRLEGFQVDSSLNAHYPHSLPDVPQRDARHDTFMLDGLLECPVTRFHDGATSGGRPLSVIGTTWPEIRHVFEDCLAQGRSSVVLVMHSNEFTRTERLWTRRPVTPRRVVSRRFQQMCEYLARNAGAMQTRHMSAEAMQVAPSAPAVLPKSTAWRTGVRMVSQFASRWY